jgi:IS5 family transposase
MDRNRLKGRMGDCIYAILSAAGMNFRKLMKFIESILRYFVRSLLFLLLPSRKWQWQQLG